MCEEKRQANDVTGERARCCGSEMERLMRAFFTGSCAEKMEEMMKDCCGFATEREKPGSDDESTID